jgi:hypothetical protein
MNGTAGTLHCFFEGYFVIHHDSMASAQDLFGQLWKEYALSDSRYMTSDTLVLCMESMTVVSILRDPAKPLKCRPADPSPAAVGTFMLCGCISDRDEALLAAPGTDDGVHEPSLRRHAILCDESIRPLRERSGLLPTGSLLFLAVLFLYEFHLDRGPGVFVVSSP